MRLKIAARASDLARIQALTVGQALERSHKNLKIDYDFRESLGDKNLSDPLWQMPEKGVFTSDFVADLESGACDLVVHSWKDLPVEERAETEIMATCLRADVRDLLLVRRDRWPQAVQTGRLRIFSSSPRRAYNLHTLLPRVLPQPESGEWQGIEFTNVRGNVPTRLRKLLAADGADALVLAKAGLDRLLAAPWAEFGDMQSEVRKALVQLQWIILPLRQNPAAAAQGALAIEARRDRHDLRELLRAIHCAETFAQVQLERQTLAAYGGGCHQKIGVTALGRDYGNLFVVRGLTDQGQVLQREEFSTLAPRAVWRAQSADEVFPLVMSEATIFSRQPRAVDTTHLKPRDLWVARAEAWPESYKPVAAQIIWCSGLKTWSKLASQGIWVNGCAESLGDLEQTRVEHLLNRPPAWLKLSHQRSRGDIETLPIYDVEIAALPDLARKKFLFWSSGVAFKEALKCFPELRHAHHACGPGLTYRTIKKEITEPSKVRIYLDHEQWRKEVWP